MLKVAGKAEKSSVTETSAEEFSVSTPAHSAEEFAVMPAPAVSHSEVEESAPAFGAELTEPAQSEMPSYMAQYLGEHAESRAAESEVTPVAANDEAAVPVFGISAPSDSSYGDDLAATMVLPKDSLQRFDHEAKPEAAIASAAGLEPTAANPVDVSVAKEAGFEPTLQSSDSPTMVLKDPALVTDAHRANMDFVTQFGTGEPGLAEELIQSMGSSTDDKSVTPDDFESRLNAAMSAFAEPSPDLSSTMDMVSASPEAISELSPSAEILNGQISPLSEARVETSSIEAIGEKMESSSAIEIPNTYPEADFAPPAIVSSEIGVEETAPTSELASVFSEPTAAEPIAQEESTLVNAVSNTVIAPAEAESSAISMEATSAPETDEAVIQQMRDAFSDLPVDHSHLNEHLESEPAPMAMAAAAAAAPAPSPLSTPMGREVEMEIARALSVAVGAEASSETSAGGQVTEISSGGDANNMAAAVENVMKRELPSLIWKIMAELDLRKRG